MSGDLPPNAPLANEPLITCVPNFSAGDPKTLAKIVSAMQTDGASLLDYSCDAAHNRSVVTIAGVPAAVVESALRGVIKAAQLIDLTRQTGVHPRIGAADVIPFVPVHGVSLAECATLARQAAMQMWMRAGVPVYLYEAAATRPDRINLEDVRRGQFEGLRDAVRSDPSRRPDIGGPDLHPTAGASAVGARNFLIAYNLFLDQPDMGAARAIAREMRGSGGGLFGVKAIAVAVNGRAQVSMNITDPRRSPMNQVYRAAAESARRHGAAITEAELIGLIPAFAYDPNDEWIRPIQQFDPELRILERRLLAPVAWPQG
jgi:glutamate formiminotransferase